MNPLKKIGILVYDGVQTSDVTAPHEVLGAAIKGGYLASEVITISISENKRITCYEGLKIMADASIFDDIDLDVLIVPGTYDVSPFVDNKQLISFIKKKGSKVAWLASNCAGAFILGKTGLLDHHKATTWPGGEKDLKNDHPACDVQFDQTVVVDGNLITSNGGLVSYEAAFTLLEKLTSPQVSKEISDSLKLSRLKGEKVL